ncbi:amidohydrolase family protein [Robertkochia solimangrovi]|uniref:amidohydrolase family protein n=1 Tax=Robertkochia solimangrovi TaxID=2213046 RepID=UPI00117C53D0|nr:amidohydrolase family protein [Robertkochia solimangrovi]TRZ43203.1 amidohydrolase [Robertkochia solimangrovi]
MKINIILSVLISALLFSCNSQPKEAFDLLIIHANVVDVANGEVYADQFIGISQDTIRIVSTNAALSEYKAADTLDAAGAYLMPGLWDNHVHFRGGDSLIAENKTLLPLFLANGITTVREAGGDITPTVLDWKAQIRKGELSGPDIFTSGPKLDGDGWSWEGSIPVTNKEEVSKALDSLQKLKVDFVKIYDGSITPEMYYEIISQASKRGFKVTGHMPMDADLNKAVALGLDGIEHLYYLMPQGSAVADSIRDLKIGFQGLPLLTETYDNDLAEKNFRSLAEKNIYVTATLYISNVLFNIPTMDLDSKTYLKYMGPGIQKTYERRIKTAMNMSEKSKAYNRKRIEKFNEMIPPIYDSGIHILAGSDCGAFNSFVYPGVSLIEELRELVKQGLTPQQALSASMINGPGFFDLSEYYGDIAPGKVGNLIVLEKNPLEDIEAIKTLEAVIKNGKTFSKDMLEKMLSEVVYD